MNTYSTIGYGSRCGTYRSGVQGEVWAGDGKLDAEIRLKTLNESTSESGDRDKTDGGEKRTKDIPSTTLASVWRWRRQKGNSKEDV